jgi:hypothetical protein
MDCEPNPMPSLSTVRFRQPLQRRSEMSTNGFVLAGSYYMGRAGMKKGALQYCTKPL